MRKYTNKKDVQKKSYYNDRFYITPTLARLDVNTDEVYIKDLEYLKTKFEIFDNYIENDEFVFYINHKDNVKVLTCLRDDLQYDLLMELSAIDYIEQKNGFEIFYEMLSLTKKKRIRIKTFIQEKEELNSVYSVFKMANWSEREMFDMYGVIITNHPNMKRILMPDDWYDYPLRKTYPLQGDEKASWYEVDKIFGKEARDTIGPEIRDSAAINRYDTKRFARLGHEVQYGVDITNGLEPEHTPLSYQEEGGVKFIKKFDPKNSKILKKRR